MCREVNPGIVRPEAPNSRFHPSAEDCHKNHHDERLQAIKLLETPLEELDKTWQAFMWIAPIAMVEHFTGLVLDSRGERASRIRTTLKVAPCFEPKVIERDRGCVLMSPRSGGPRRPVENGDEWRVAEDLRVVEIIIERFFRYRSPMQICDLLSLFFPEDQVARLDCALNLPWRFAAGIITLKPIDTAHSGDDATVSLTRSSLHVQLHWQPHFPDHHRPPSTTRGLAGLENTKSARSYVLKYRPTRPSAPPAPLVNAMTGDIFDLTTPDPITLPLPPSDLLLLAFYMNAIVRWLGVHPEWADDNGDVVRNDEEDDWYEYEPIDGCDYDTDDEMEDALDAEATYSTEAAVDFAINYHLIQILTSARHWLACAS